ncbi:MAG: sigma-54-dependent Fis family transcriptional regulator [Proteobacteria bacterium]|nr:sigma-54-dependent Fis family transcriptional regulator [Pseudomonadota bacterium]
MQPRKIFSLTLGEESNALIDELRKRDWEVVTATDPGTARNLLANSEFKVCLLALDQATPELAAKIVACVNQARSSEWVGVLPPGTLEMPAYRELILDGFFDYHTLPVDPGYLSRTLGHAWGRATLRDGLDRPQRSAASMGMVGQSAVMEALRSQIRKVAATQAPVLISGESGSGKELAAQAIHKCSSRANGPFVAVNCGAIAPNLIQSELFGHERGAFTGASADKRGLIEMANGGTIFLDEIGDLPRELQINLLRFLQEKTINRVGATRALPVDVRVLAASHVNLVEAVSSGQFREDLFYRLNVLTIAVPALREHKDDVPLLAQHFYQQCTAGKKTKLEGFSRHATAAMMAHDWPGNVRELFNRVQRAVVMTDRRLITPADLGLAPEEAGDSVGLDTARTNAERDAIAVTFNRVGRNVTHAARELGISRMTLYRLMEKHGIPYRTH